MKFYRNGRDINMVDTIWKLRKSAEKRGISSIYNPKSFFTRKANISAPMEFKCEQL